MSTYIADKPILLLPFSFFLPFSFLFPSRFLTVASDNEATLQFLPAGEYIAVEVVNLHVENDIEYAKYFHEIEQEWIMRFDYKPHIGKSFAFCRPFDDNNDFYAPFCDKQIINSIISDGSKISFEEYRQNVDPKKIFYAGGAVELVNDDVELSFTI